MKKDYVYVVTVVYEISAGLIGQQLIGVVDYQKTAFEMFENFDAVELYKDELIEGTKIEVGKPSKGFGVDEFGTPYYEEIIRVHGEESEHTSGTIIKSIYRKELA